ncbi:Uncharacterised protein [Afipia felis]|uniref:Uncharacterized protein n=2 Tax=Afipia felis TaxID=1035 RepID=A0A380W7T3_AFIFE|nr:hypothetical protein HMPREF9697_00770 [Afipia felis ATCC 53690]SUU76952.1 Uncharacterised protein [Afipia felis]SUU85018.1 Uncharacterised protein [Afipia felis]
MRLRGIILVLGTAVGAYALGAASHAPAPPPPTPLATLPQPVPQSTRPSAPPPKRTAKPEVARPANQPLQLVPQRVSNPPITPQPAQPTETRRRKPDAKAALTAAAIAALIVTASRNAYHSTGRPCACPDDRMRNGRRCGSRSAYSRPGGAAPKCFADDVTAEMIEDYRKTMMR